MSEPRKYGDMNPGDLFDAEMIFDRAMKEFLWPDATITKDRRRVAASKSFRLWCRWWQRVLCGSREVEALPDVFSYIDEEFKRCDADAIAAVADKAALKERWEAAWSMMFDGKSETPKPLRRAAQRGMKFCLIVLVLRYGLASGRTKKAGKRKLPDGQEAERVDDVGLSLQEASEAASHLLALSVLTPRDKTNNMRHISDAEIKDRSSLKGAWCEQHMEEILRDADLNDFKKAGVGLAGFKKRLRVTAPEKWGKVHRLALEYERQAGKLWMKRERLECWFPAC